MVAEESALRFSCAEEHFKNREWLEALLVLSRVECLCFKDHDARLGRVQSVSMDTFDGDSNHIKICQKER